MLVGLGVWQIERLHWKENLIHTVDVRLHAEPVPLERVIAHGVGDDAEWMRVTAHGRFKNEGEQYLFAPGPHGEQGVQVITPFITDDGDLVLVNRGFVPDAKRDPATRAAGQIEGVTRVTGILRLSRQPGWFTPPTDRAHRLWFVKDAVAMGRIYGDAHVLPLFVEADATPNPGGYPIGGQTVVDFPNDHLSYAVTWFGLALALLGVYLAYHVRQGRLKFGK